MRNKNISTVITDGAKKMQERVREIEAENAGLKAELRQIKFSSAVRLLRSAARYLEEEKFHVGAEINEIEDAINILELCEIKMFEDREKSK